MSIYPKSVDYFSSAQSIVRRTTSGDGETRAFITAGMIVAERRGESVVAVAVSVSGIARSCWGWWWYKGEEVDQDVCVNGDATRIQSPLELT